MSTLKTYELDALRVASVVLSGQNPEVWDGQLNPGDMVFHHTDGGEGMVVAINDTEVCVLWSKEPKNAFSSIVFPIVRRVHPTLIANQIVSIQPMTAPSGLIFYMDYQYGKNTGRWPVRMTRKACQWMRTFSRRCSSACRRWWQSLWCRTPATLPTAATSNVSEQQEVIKAIVKK